MKIINSQDYNDIDAFFNDFNECVRTEKEYRHPLHCSFKNLSISFDCDEIECWYSLEYKLYKKPSLEYKLYKKHSLIGFLSFKDITSANFWFISYQ